VVTAGNFAGKPRRVGDAFRGIAGQHEIRPR
jgi:hypothetical protein